MTQPLGGGDGVTLTTPGDPNGNVPPGTTDQQLLKFTLQSDGNENGTGALAQIRLFFGPNNTAVYSNVAGGDDLNNMRLYRDDGSVSGSFDVSDTQISSFYYIHPDEEPTFEVFKWNELMEPITTTPSNFFIVADVTAGAIDARVIEMRMEDAKACATMRGSLSVPTDTLNNYAFNSPQLTVGTGPSGDTLTVQLGGEGQIGNANLNKTDTDVEVLRWQMDSDTSDNSQVVVSDVKISFVSGDNTKISNLYLYEDTGTIGVHDGETVLTNGTFSWNAGGYYELTSFSETVTGVKKYLVCADLNGVEADSIQLQLRAKPGTPDGILINTGGAGDANDSVTDHASISGATITINGDALSGDDAGGQIGAGSATQGEADVELLRFRLVNDGNGDNSVETTTVRLSHVQGANTDITNVRLVRDTGTLGVLEAESPIGGTFSWTGSVWELVSLTETVAGTVDYLVAVDITGGAALGNVQLQLNATPGAPDGLVVNTATGDTVTNAALTGGAINITSVPKDTLTVAEGGDGQIGNANNNKADTDVEMLRWQMDSDTGDNSQVVVSDVKINFVSGDNTKISNLYLYEDTGTIGVHDGETVLTNGTFSWNASGYYELTAFSETVTGVKKYLVCADLNGVEAGAIQLQLRATPGAPDGIIINTGGAGDLNDIVTGYAAINGATITINGDALSADDGAGQIGAASPIQGEADVEMLRFRLVNDGNGDNSVETTTVSLSHAQGADTDITNVRLVRDTGTLGVLEAESPIGGTFSWTGSVWELASLTETVAGTVDYLVAVDITGGAALGNVQLQLNATPGAPGGLVVTTTTGDAVTNAAVTGGVITVNAAPGDTLTVQLGGEGQIGSGNANKAEADVEMLRWQMDSDAVDNSQVLVNDVKISFASGANTMISNLYLYEDTGTIGVHDGEAVLTNGTFSWNASGYYELTAFSETVTGVKKYLVCADLNGAEADAIQLQLRAKPGTPDGILINTGGAGDTNDAVSDHAAISGAVITVNGDGLSGDDAGGQIGAGSATQSEADVEMLRFRLVNDGNGDNSVETTTVRLSHAQGANTDITNVRLVRDTGTLGVLEAESPIGGTFSWTGSVWELTPISETVAGTVDYLVAVDITGGAALGNVQLQLNATPGAPGGLVVTTTSGDAVTNAALTGGAINVTAAPGDVLTVQEGGDGQIGSGNANKADADVEMLRWQMDASSVDDGEVVVSDVKISFASGADTMISNLYLYVDTGTIGLHDGETSIGTFNWNASGYYELTAFSESVTGTKKYLVCADLNGTEADAIQLRLRAKPGAPDGIIIDTGGAGDSNDSLGNFTAISGATITVNGDNLSANDSAGQIGAGTPNQADTDVELLRFKLVNDTNGDDSVEVTNVRLSKVGSWAEANLTNIAIYRDSGTLGVLDGETALTNGTFSWNATYWELTSFSETVSGSVDYLVVADIDPSAALEAVQVQLNATAGAPDGLVITTATGDAVSNAAITGGALTIQLLPKDTLTVQEGGDGQIGSGNADKAEADVEMLRWQMDSDTGDNSQVLVNDVKISFASGADTMISNLYLYVDTGTIGVHDGEGSIGTFSWNAAGYYELTAFSETVTGTRKYLVCANLNATESDSIQLQLRAKPGSPDGILINTGGAGDLNDIVSDFSAISGAVISINGDSVSADDSGGQIGADAPLQGATDIELLRFKTIPDGNGNNSATITTVRLSHAQGADTDLTNIRLVRDTGTLGVLESEPAIGTTFSWTGSVWELSSISETASGTVDYLVVADIDPSAALQAVQVQLNATPGAPDGLVINSPDNMGNAAITGGVITVSSAPNPDTPNATSPTGNPTVTVTPTLQADPMTGGSGSHASSQFQVCTDIGCGSVEVDSGEIAATTSWMVSPALTTSTHYWWQVRYKDSNGQWSGYSSTTNFDFTTEVQAFGNVLLPGWNMVFMSQIYTTTGDGTLTNSAVDQFGDDTSPATPFMIEWQSDGVSSAWTCGSCSWSGDIAGNVGDMKGDQGYFFYANGNGITLNMNASEGANYADLISTPVNSVIYSLSPGANLVGNPYSQSVKLSGGGAASVKIIRDPGGANEEQTFLYAADPSRLWVSPVIYYYEGVYTGYTQKHCADVDNEMIPWTGYWIRVVDTVNNYEIKFISP